MLRVMIVGASGVFGSRLARLAAGEPGVALILAGRREAPLQELAREIDGSVRLFDRSMARAEQLQGVDLLIDCAGPFQGSDTRLVEAAIAAGVDYVDLSDGREWVSWFAERWDAVAKDRGVRLVSGASSIPALSHAVIDRLAAGLPVIENLWVGIFPGNRAPRGRSVVEAILSYAGKPVSVFERGRWVKRRGWGGLHLVDCGFAGKRWASICDTPEQELLVRRYQPRDSAEFYAGMELSLLHLGLWLCAWPVRWGLLKSLRPFAGPMLRIAEWLKPLGSDRGAMLVRVDGRNVHGEAVRREWKLSADANRGPNVPVLATLALIRRWRDDRKPPVGAGACSGILSLDDFEWDLARLGLIHDMRVASNQPKRPMARYAA